MPSVCGLALATIATGALREVMQEGFRVELAPEAPLDMAEKLSADMLVCVFLGDEVLTPHRRRMFEGTRVVELIVQVILPPALALQLGEVRLAPKTQGAGALLAFTTAHRLIERALSVGPPGSWRALLQAFVTGFPEDLHGLPGYAPRKDKLSIPLEDYSIPCGMINSPAIGSELPEPWTDLLAKMRAEPRFAPSADFLAALLTGEALPLWQAEQVRAGLSIAEGNALGIGVIPPLTDTPPTDALVIEGLRGQIVVTPEAAP